ncbi:MAG: hypothetical protein KA523_03640 [Flavobacterium sp.]|nr:hypothetical protein [Flavobacterium sp.]
MKNKISLFALLGLSIAFVAYVIKYPPTKVPMTNDNNICADYSNESINELDVKLIHNMVDNYKNKQLTYINAGMNAEDAHSIWFDLKTLKKFVYQLEYQAKKNEATATIDKLGVRIYYAAYPDVDNMRKYSDIDWFLGDSIRKRYHELHTLVMIPTINTNNGDVDFNPTDKSTFNKNGLKNNIDKYGNNSSLTTFGITGTLRTNSIDPRTGAQNHGTLIPPGNPTLENFYP